MLFYVVFILFLGVLLVKNTKNATFCILCVNFTIFDYTLILKNNT